MEYAICTVTAAGVRKEPGHKAEMVNQLLFGETMEVLEAKEEWFKIRSMYDNYEGWLTYHLINEIDEKTATQESNHIATHHLNPVTTSNDVMFATIGSPLTGYNSETKKLWDNGYEYHGHFRDITEPVSEELFKEIIGLWLNAPYLWGGKTFMGVDCSGFVQMVYKLMGIKLKRDAYQQAEQGSDVELSNLKEGDLAFFHNENGRVTHVGIILNNNKIIHASGKVRIDKLGEQGIINSETGKRTHLLYSIKRYF